jgi:hypothetical protein
MESHLRRKFRRLYKNQEGGIATYVLIMFGLCFVMYLFGFHSLWVDYQSGSDLGNNSTLEYGRNFLNTFAKVFTDNIGLATGGLLAFFGALVVSRLAFGSQATATVLSFSIPLMILIVLNIFIFPIGGIAPDIGFLNASGITLFLLAFFNLFYILAVVEFIRGNI